MFTVGHLPPLLGQYAISFMFESNFADTLESRNDTTLYVKGFNQASREEWETQFAFILNRSIRKHPKVRTTCFILRKNDKWDESQPKKDKWEEVAVGVTYLNEKDVFCKANGRRVALTKALSNWTELKSFISDYYIKDMRHQIWDTYFQYHADLKSKKEVVMNVA